MEDFTIFEPCDLLALRIIAIYVFFYPVNIKLGSDYGEDLVPKGLNIVRNFITLFDGLRKFLLSDFAFRLALHPFDVLRKGSQ